jgi:actin-related protein
MTAIQERLKNMEIFFDQKEYLVIDHGTGFIKAGFSGEDLPRIIIPTVVGTH